MSRKNVPYILLVVVIAAGSALAGGLAGGAIVYRNLQQPSAALTRPLQEVIPAGNTPPQQMLTLNTTDIETAITQAVEQVGPAVVTVVGMLPGQVTIFGPTADQTVSGTGSSSRNREISSPKLVM
jgi:uncharacterized membrane protein